MGFLKAMYRYIKFSVFDIEVSWVHTNTQKFLYAQQNHKDGAIN